MTNLYSLTIDYATCNIPIHLHVAQTENHPSMKQKPHGTIDVLRQLLAQGISINQLYRYLQRMGYSEKRINHYLKKM